ncbi:hypothetical protein PGT21_028630 [Puccinia graminis f. sp. tritici]|uniref:Tet-like 2OG-Fe(II) oxygenase domain-containing protein n=1 Tax=Puccinia graminis f. sp. tritici TaxID=56615 RepID=A0A5B0P9U5_PUCGR|nr:hypothetical protein PGT21_028630 [Puccinia graminis f. sp. tritici]
MALACGLVCTRTLNAQHSSYSSQYSPQTHLNTHRTHLNNSSHNNASRKASKKRCKAKKQQETREQLLKRTLNPSDTTHFVNWRRVKYEELDLYPTIPVDRHKKPTRPPTPEEIKSAYDQVETFHLFKTGRNIVQDPLDKESIIAFIDFIKFEDMSEQDKADLNLFTTFLHRSKKFISPVAVDSRSWGGLMWVIGWRKSSDGDQIVGRYIKKFETEDMEDLG